MLKNKATWGIAVLLLAISFTYFTGSVYAGKASAPSPVSETVNTPSLTVTFNFNSNGIAQKDVELRVYKQSDNSLQYIVSNITSPHTSSISFASGTSYYWNMANLSTKEVSASRTFSTP